MEEAAARCPFLRNVSKNAALSLDHAVAVLAGKAHERQRKGGRRGPVFEEGDAFSAAFDMFHGPGGVVPLKKVSAAAVGAAPVSCSASSHASGLGVRRAHPAAFASISIGAFGPPLVRTPRPCYPRPAPASMYPHVVPRNPGSRKP